MLDANESTPGFQYQTSYVSGNDPKELDVHMFLKEALIMKDFSHDNVMQLIGLCFGIESLPLVVLPYMKKGDVLSYIRNAQNVRLL